MAWGRRLPRIPAGGGWSFCRHGKPGRGTEARDRHPSHARREAGRHSADDSWPRRHSHRRGVALGVVLAAGLARMLANLLFGVQPGDVAVFVTTTLTIAFVALLSSWMPARRASSVDPVESLRAE